jgi:hypothetical protein
MTKEREALKLALVALEEAHYKHEHRQDTYKRGQAILTIEQALAQPRDSVEQEPVAKYLGECNEGSLVHLYEEVAKGTPLYTTPPKREPLTDAERKTYQAGHNAGVAHHKQAIKREWVGLSSFDMDDITSTTMDSTDAMLLTEAKLKELNHE